MPKHRPKFHIYSAECPNCGSRDTKIDLWGKEKLRRLLAASIGLAVGYLPSEIPMRCCECKASFNT